MLPSQFFQQGAVDKDSKRIYLCSRKSSESYIKRRKQLRAKRKGYTIKKEKMKVGIHMLQEVQACERLSEYAD